MKIELRHIRVYDQMSQETTAYYADVYINGIKACNATNQGTGGPDMFSPYREKGKALMNEAESWCKTLPPAEAGFAGEDLSRNNSFEFYIGDLLDEYLAQREVVRLNREIDKEMLKNIVVGIRDEQYRVIKFNGYSFTEMLGTTDGLVKLERLIKKQVIPDLTFGEQVLNNNLPQEIMERLGLKVKESVLKATEIPKKRQGLRK